MITIDYGKDIDVLWMSLGIIAFCIIGATIFVWLFKQDRFER